MSQYIDGPVKTFVADAAIAKYARVKLESDDRIVTAGLADQDIGVTEAEAFAAGDRVPVRLRSASGTHKAIAIEACDAGALLYTEADGKVQDTAQATSFLRGVAMESAGADGDIIEIMPLCAGTAET